MESTFPFGLPGPTAFYLVLYVLTFAIHQAFIHYVLTGSIYVAWTAIWPGRAVPSRFEQPLAATLRDWMPFALSAAITAGVAPLLFVQIVYPRQFYTANLLLSWRWMIVIPVLITAFYLLYLVKSPAVSNSLSRNPKTPTPLKLLDPRPSPEDGGGRFGTVSKWPYVVRMAVVLVVAGCFLFVGFCWTANHLIANREAEWPTIYASGQMSLSATTVALRMLVWIGGACGTMAVIAGWQLAAETRSQSSVSTTDETRRLALFSLGGLAIATSAATAYLIRSDESVRTLILGSFALPYSIAAAVGVAVQVVAWAMRLRGSTSRWPLVGASIGCVVTLLAVSVLREADRLAAVDIVVLHQGHAKAAEIGGWPIFLAFAVINFALIAICIWLVKRSLSKAEKG